MSMQARSATPPPSRQAHPMPFPGEALCVASPSTDSQLLPVTDGSQDVSWLEICLLGVKKFPSI